MRRARALGLVLLALMPLAGKLPAQVLGQRVWIGLIGGASYSNFTGNGTEGRNLEWRTGWVGGGFIEYSLSPRVAIALEGTLVQKGARREQVSTTSGLAYRLYYFDLPLLVRFALAPGATVRPAIVLGPWVGFEVDCKEKISFNGQPINANCNEPPERKSMDFGAVGGLELWWKRYAVGLRYTRSLSEVLEEGTAVPEIRNHGFLLTLAVRF